MHLPLKIVLTDNRVMVHFVFETLAFIIGVRLYYYLKRNTNDIIGDTNRLWILLGAMIGALIGSRLIAVLEIPSEIMHQTWLSLYKNKTVAGGFLGGLFGVELCKKIIGVKASSGDIYVFPIIVAVFIGRIGCFFMGTEEPTYGIETNFFTGMDLGDGKLRHPVALYEMFFMLVLFLLFYSIRNKKMIDGDRFKLFMVLYFMYRFFVEFLKPYNSLFLDLSIIQWCGLFLLIYYYKFLIRLFKYA